MYDLNNKLKKVQPYCHTDSEVSQARRIVFMNQYAKVTVQSISSEQSQPKQKAEVAETPFNIYSHPFSQKTVNKFQFKKL